jgi:hypothetical protein
MAWHGRLALELVTQVRAVVRRQSGEVTEATMLMSGSEVTEATTSVSGGRRQSTAAGAHKRNEKEADMWVRAIF